MGVLSIKEHQENALRHLQVTNSCDPSNVVDCVEGFVKDSDPPEKCKYACGVPSTGSRSTGGDCCNRDSDDGYDACEGFTGQVCKDKDTSTGFPGSCSGNDACKNANIVSVYKSCTGPSSCKDAGSEVPEGNEGYVGELIDSCVGSASCLGIGSGGFVGKITSSCRDTKACYGASGYVNGAGGGVYGGGGTVVGIYNSCNEESACGFLGSKDGFVGIVTDSCGGGTKACYNAAYDGGAIQEIVNSCNAERACDGLTSAAQTRMLEKKSKPPKEPKTPNPNKPPAPAPKPANPNKPEPNTPNPNKPTPPPTLDPLETPAPGPTLPPVPDGALCLVDCCTDPTCAGTYSQSELKAKGCPAKCSGSITPWGA